MRQNIYSFSKNSKNPKDYSFDQRVKNAFVKISDELDFQFALMWNPEGFTINKLFSLKPIKADMQTNLFLEEQNYSL